MYKHFLLAVLAAVLLTGCMQTEEEQKQPVTRQTPAIRNRQFSAEALWAMGRIGSVAVDAETGVLAYTVSYYSVPENRSTTWIRICEQTSDTVSPLRVTDEFVGSDPAWFGNGGVLAYLRDGKLFLRQDGKDLPVSGYDSDIDGFLLSPKRDRIILVSQVKTVASTADRYPDLPLASGRVVEDLMYKHWDEWTETAPQPFVAELRLKAVGEGNRIASAAIGGTLNLLEGTPYESPMKPFGGMEQLCWSPDGGQIAYTCRKKAGIDYALSTNSDIYLYDLASATTRNLTEGMAGYDTNPAFSPDGTKLAWLSMERDGYESDLNRLFVMDMQTGEKTFLSRPFESNVDDYRWLDDTCIVFSGVWHALSHLWLIDLNGRLCELTDGQYDYLPADILRSPLAPEYTVIYTLRHSMREGNELFCFHPADLNLSSAREDVYRSGSLLEQNGLLRQLTFENKPIYDRVDMGTVVPRWQTTTDGKRMLTWIIYPPHFDPQKKYPTLLYCEGGPQSPVSQFWSYRWNFMRMAAHDYIIVAPNRRGLPGFGIDWNEQISGDYGGQCMRDYLTAIDEFCTEPYVDRDRLGCVGASFGGFSVYWLAGHHNHRFKAFIAHDGIFNMEMQYLETEEKWFANWDMGGAYWEKDNPVAQRTFSNSPHRFVDKWDTPILCIHGEKDYRILANQGMAAFDAAKMRGIPAELLIFPDENHWVLRPQNGILWQREFIGWLDKWLK